MSNSLVPANDWAAAWQRFYKQVFGLKVDFTNVKISVEQTGFDLVVMIAQGLTLNQAWAKCTERFQLHSFLGNDLDKAVSTNDRTSSQSYAKRFRDRVEADEENKNLSANTLAKRKVSCITLLERLVFELWFYSETGDHLDMKDVTLCAGSRLSGGFVPCVHCGDSRLLVSCCFPYDAFNNIHARSAV